MLFYSLYALTGFGFGVYVVYNLQRVYVFSLLLVYLVVILFMCFVKRLKVFVLSALVFAVFSEVGLWSMERESLMSGFTDEFVTVTGRVSEIPYKDERGMWCYTLNCKELDYQGTKTEFKKRILLYSENEYNIDDTIEVSGFLKLHDMERNPGCFNGYTYYKSLGIDYKITSFEDGLSKTSIKSNSPYAVAMRVRTGVCDIIDEGFLPDNATVLKYIMTDFKKGLDSDFTSPLLNSGVLRCLYSPYFHLILILAVLGLVLENCPVGLKHIITIIFCIIYLCINPYILTARKLFLLIIIYEILRLNKKIFRRIDIFWLVILICGIQNPYLLYNEGFLLSCSATGFIIIFFNKIYESISWINKHGMIINILVMYFVSFILLMPIASFLFDGISAYSIIVSVILLPVICVIYLVSPFMLFEVGFLGVEGIFKLITENLVTFIRIIPKIIQRLPFSYITLPRPPAVLILGILFLFGAFYKKKYHRTFALLLSISLGFFISFGVGEVLRAGKMTVTFLNTAQGDCTLTDIPYKCSIMVDGGGSVEDTSEYDVGERDVFPYLRHNNIRTIDYVFLSHYHKDHADGIISLMELVKIKNIFLPDCLKDNEYRVIIEKRARELGIKLHYIKQCGKIELEDGLFAEILYFDKNAKEENDTSVVMRITYGGVACLYTGDITTLAEEEILRCGTDVSADILKVAHHSSYKSNSIEFLKAVNPKIAVAMFSKSNPYGFPSYETKDRFKNLNIPFITTAQEGCIQIREKSGRIIWQRKTR